MCTPSGVFLCSSGFQKYDSQKLTAYVQVSALSKCLVNLSEVGSHVYHSDGEIEEKNKQTKVSIYRNPWLCSRVTKRQAPESYNS